MIQDIGSTAEAMFVADETVIALSSE